MRRGAWPWWSDGDDVARKQVVAPKDLGKVISEFAARQMSKSIRHVVFLFIPSLLDLSLSILLLCVFPEGYREPLSDSPEIYRPSSCSLLSFYCS